MITPSTNAGRMTTMKSRALNWVRLARDFKYETNLFER